MHQQLFKEPITIKLVDSTGEEFLEITGNHEDELFARQSPDEFDFINTLTVVVEKTVSTNPTTSAAYISHSHNKIEKLNKIIESAYFACDNCGEYAKRCNMDDGMCMDCIESESHCSVCSGTGLGQVDGQPCYSCNGKGA